MADEVLTGAGRTGTWSALEPYGVVPDIMTLGKGISRRICPAVGGRGAAAAGGRAGAGLGRVAPRPDILPSSDALRGRGRHDPVSPGPRAHRALRGNWTGVSSAAGGAPRASRGGRRSGQGTARRHRVRGRQGHARHRFPAPPASPRRFAAAALEAGLVVWPNVGQADGVNGDLAMLAPPFVDHRGPDRRAGPAVRAGGRATVERMESPAMSAPTKITYTSASGDLEEFHQPSTRAWRPSARSAGARHPFYIGGEAAESRLEPLIDRSPIDTGLVLGTFACAGGDDVDRAVPSAQRGAARRGHGSPGASGSRPLRRAAGADPRPEVRAGRDHEPGGGQEPARGDGRRGGVAPTSSTTTARRSRTPTGSSGRWDGSRRWSATPTCCGPTASSPASRRSTFPSPSRPVCRRPRWRPGTPSSTSRRRTRRGPGLKLYEVYRDAGLPAGVFNLLVGRREDIGDALWQHPGVDGVVFTGSKAGGHADPRRAERRAGSSPACSSWAGRTRRSSCPAPISMPRRKGSCARRSASRIRSAAPPAGSTCTGRSPTRSWSDCSSAPARIRIGDPSERDVFFGPVINERAVERYERAVAQAQGRGHGAARRRPG